MEMVDIYFENLYLFRTIFVCHDSLSSNKLFHTIKNANGNKNYNLNYDNLIGQSCMNLKVGLVNQPCGLTFSHKCNTIHSLMDFKLRKASLWAVNGEQ